MRPCVQNLVLSSAMLLTFSAFLSPALQAQDDGPPKILVVQREYLKPGKGGMLHDRSESAFVRALSSGDPKIYYIAMDSLSGRSRSLFLESFNSLAEWEKEQAALSSNKEMAAALDHAAQMDGDLLSSADSMALMYRPELSFNKGHIKGTRYFEITTFVVKPGHVHDFMEVEHLYADAYRKISPNEQWDCFEVVYGSPVTGVPQGTTFVVFRLMHSLSEADTWMESSEKISSTLGPDAMKRASDLIGASIESEGTNLFAINPRMSNPSPQFVKGDPAFWTGPVASTGETRPSQ